LINNIQQKSILPNLNIIFNGIKIKTIPGYRYGHAYGYGYNYGYGYGYGYGYTEEAKREGLLLRFKKWWKAFLR
jgi:hypothetical protein